MAANRSTSQAVTGIMLGRPQKRRRSLGLFGQMALGTMLVALTAVTVVAVSTVVVFSIAFRNYQGAALATEAQRVSSTIGEGGYFSQVNGPAKLRTLADRRLDSALVWVMDSYGHYIVSPRTTALTQRVINQDKQDIEPALLHALNGGSSDGALHDTALLGQRVYAIVPIYLNNNTQSEIVGAVALTTPPRASNAAFTVFQVAVERVVLATSIAAIAIGLLAAVVLSRRLAAPLRRLSRATAAMATGDYSTRVSVRSPQEYALLAASFNDMAASLERDVRLLRQQEALRRELVANVSHELATPLTAIAGFTDALLDGMLTTTEQRTETVRLIARESARLRRLVDQLRQVARYEGGAQALKREPLHLAALVEEALHVLTPEMARKHVTVRNGVETALPTVYADDDRLTEVLLNLLDNATRHVPEGGQVEIDARREGGFVRIAVADSGPGIPTEARGRIFDRFFRVDSSRSSATGGSGLGLAIVRSLVEAHGGTIDVAERSGGGALFSFTLPVYTGAMPGIAWVG
ncbi:MAG TPA: HAMP domain-containing sensor histidine kinase [Ktedonobacterales bacterium]